MGSLREIIKKNMMNTKIVGLHYSDKQRRIVFEIFELVNQPFLTRDVYLIFFSNSICVYCRKRPFSFFF